MLVFPREPLDGQVERSQIHGGEAGELESADELSESTPGERCANRPGRISITIDTLGFHPISVPPVWGSDRLRAVDGVAGSLKRRIASGRVPGECEIESKALELD